MTHATPSGSGTPGDPRDACRAAVITGVSTGIGFATARVLIDAGWRVFGSVRTGDDARSAQSALGPRFVPLVFDVTDEAAVRAAAARVRAELGGATLDGLVNNAGIVVPGPLLELPLDGFRHQFEVNVTGVLAVTQAFAPLLGAGPAHRGRPGRIVNISSVGGRSAMPFVTPYHASKFALEGLSEGLRRELMLFGIDVVVVAPGPVKSEIWRKGDEADLERFRGTPYQRPLELLKARAREQGRRGLDADRVGRLVLHALTTSRPRVRYVVTPRPVLTRALGLLPKRLVDRLIASRLGLRRPPDPAPGNGAPPAAGSRRTRGGRGAGCSGTRGCPRA